MTTFLRPVADLLRSLDALEPDDITLDGVASVVGAEEFTDHDLAPYLNFRAEKYTRNLIRRNELFDVILICWSPGQATPIHDHSGQLGWVRVLRGALEEQAFTPVGRSGQAFDDPCAFAKAARLEPGPLTRFEAGPAVATVDRDRAIHRLANPGSEPSDRAVSLHVYSRPHDSCLRFEADTGRAERVELSFDTQPEADLE